MFDLEWVPSGKYSSSQPVIGIFLMCILLTGMPLSVHFLPSCCCLSRVVLLADTSRVGPQHPGNMPLSRKLFVTDQLTGFIWSVDCFPQTIWDCLSKGDSVWEMIWFKFYRTAIIQEGTPPWSMLRHKTMNTTWRPASVSCKISVRFSLRCA